MELLNRRLREGRNFPSQRVAFYFGGCPEKLSTTEQLQRAWPLLLKNAIFMYWEFEGAEDETDLGWAVQKMGLYESDIMY